MMRSVSRSTNLVHRPKGGQRVKDYHLQLFQSSSDPSYPLTFEGERNEEDLLDGRILAGEKEVGHIRDEIASFGEPAKVWDEESVTRLRQADQIARGWDNSIQQAMGFPLWGVLCDSLAAVDGVILEVATGPGGGHTPAVLTRNPIAQILVNDGSVGILALWKDLLSKRNAGSRVSLAAFDARVGVLRDSSISAVSNCVGFGNIEGSAKAIDEICRALRPGGMICSFEFVIAPEDWQKMPDEERGLFESLVPTVTKGLGPMLADKGFILYTHELTPGREMVAEGDGIAAKAAEYGVTLHADFEYVRACRPPSGQGDA